MGGMIVSHARKLIVFSNPKTGSESLRALLSDLNDERVRPWRQRSAAHPFYPHMPPVEARAVFRSRGWDWDGYRRVTVVRNPYARLVSLYRMIRDVDGLWRMRALVGLGVPGFRDWLIASRPDGRGGGGRRHQRWRRFGTWSAYHWTHDAAGTPLVTDILRLERLADDLSPLLDALGYPPGAAPAQTNARAPVDWAGWYDWDSSALVARRYAWELERFYRIEPIAPSRDRVA